MLKNTSLQQHMTVLCQTELSISLLVLAHKKRQIHWSSYMQWKQQEQGLLFIYTVRTQLLCYVFILFIYKLRQYKIIDKNTHRGKTSNNGVFLLLAKKRHCWWVQVIDADLHFPRTFLLYCFVSSLFLHFNSFFDSLWRRIFARNAWLQ